MLNTFLGLYVIYYVLNDVNNVENTKLLLVYTANSLIYDTVSGIIPFRNKVKILLNLGVFYYYSSEYDYLRTFM